MAKNGLFLCSIGLLLFLYAFNPQTASYNWLTLIAGVVLIAIGSYIVFKVKPAKKTSEDEVKK